jgi:hypothetical protein
MSPDVALGIAPSPLWGAAWVTATSDGKSSLDLSDLAAFSVCAARQ